MEIKNPEIIDLSYTISSDMLVYPGTERPSFRWVGRVNSEGYNLTKMWMLTHTGTHADAPNHYVENAPGIDEVPPRHFFGRAKLYRYKQKLNGQIITLDDVISSGFQLEEDIIFVLQTGIERYGEQKEYNELYPVPSEDLLQALIDHRIRAYMTDTTAIDPVNTIGSPNHHHLLGSGIPIVENLRNLHKLPENKFFIISALPLKLRGRDGAPCRAIALPDIEHF